MARQYISPSVQLYGVVVCARAKAGNMDAAALDLSCRIRGEIWPFFFL